MIRPEFKSEAAAEFSSRPMAWPADWGVFAGAAENVGGGVGAARRAATPWWLWWNVLSLDAPMVAVVWALVFAQSARVALPGAEVAALGLMVWLIYTADRLLDGRATQAAFGPPLRQRHAFHRIHARAIAIAAAGVATITAILGVSAVGGQVFRLAVPLGILLVVYMAWVHVGRGRVLARLPKEMAVGGIFAAGVALPAWARIASRRWEFFLLAILFAAVCTLNCAAIEEWEKSGERDSWTGGLRFVAADFGSGKFAAALAVCATLLTPVVRLRGSFSAIGAAIAVSALLILVLDLMRERISVEALRVLVDVALLLPALVVLAVR